MRTLRNLVHAILTTFPTCVVDVIVDYTLTNIWTSIYERPTHCIPFGNDVIWYRTKYSELHCRGCFPPLWSMSREYDRCEAIFLLDDENAESTRVCTVTEVGYTSAQYSIQDFSTGNVLESVTGYTPGRFFVLAFNEQMISLRICYDAFYVESQLMSATQSRQGRYVDHLLLPNTFDIVEVFIHKQHLYVICCHWKNPMFMVLRYILYSPIQPTDSFISIKPDLFEFDFHQWTGITPIVAKQNGSLVLIQGKNAKMTRSHFALLDLHEMSLIPIAIQGFPSNGHLVRWDRDLVYVWTGNGQPTLQSQTGLVRENCLTRHWWRLVPGALVLKQFLITELIENDSASL